MYADQGRAGPAMFTHKESVQHSGREHSHDEDNQPVPAEADKHEQPCQIAQANQPLPARWYILADMMPHHGLTSGPVLILQH